MVYMFCSPSCFHGNRIRISEPIQVCAYNRTSCSERLTVRIELIAVKNNICIIFMNYIANHFKIRFRL